MLSKRCQMQKIAYCTIPFIQTSKRKILIYSDGKQISWFPWPQMRTAWNNELWN